MAQRVKPLLRAPIVPVLNAGYSVFLIQLLANAPGRQQTPAQVLELLPVMWVTWMEFLAPALAWPNPSH